jgi:hypothetical protein
MKKQNCFNINLKNAELRYTKNPIKSCVSKIYLDRILHEYFGSDKTEEADKIRDTIWSQRDVKIRETIKIV